MEENNFEKQVRQKMEELKIAPSEAVWENVNSRIAKRKSRRWALLFFSFVFLALLCGSYWYFNSSNNSSDKRIEASNINSSLNNNDSSLKKGNNSDNQKNNSQSATSKTKQVIADSTKQNSEVSTSKAISTIQKKSRRRINDTKPYRSSVAINSPQPEENVSEKKNIQGEPGNIQPVPLETRENVDTVITKSGDGVAENDNVLKVGSTAIKERIDADITSPANPENKKVRKHENENKFYMGIFIAGGVSHVGNEFFGLGNSVNRDFLQSPVSSGGAGGGTVVINPSEVKNGAGLMAGFFVGKNISKKIDLSFGINYKSFNTSIIVGKRNDTTGSFAYYSLNSGGGKQQYKNRFSFIELPLHIRIEITNSKKLPLYWNGGISLSQLISSNALQFDPYNSIYYKDNAAFNKTQLDFTTGLSTRLFQNQKTEVLFGPYFNYATSSLASKGLYHKKHFVFFGLHSELIFGKK